MPEALEGCRVLITTDAVGGVWTYTLDLARELGGAGMECVIAVMGPAPGAGMLEKFASIPRAKVIVTSLPLDWMPGSAEAVILASQELAKLARAQGCDVVQLHTPALAAAGVFASPVMSVHHSCPATWWLAVRSGQNMPEDLRWRRLLVAKGIAESDVVVAPTTALAHAVADAYGLASVPLVVRNGRSMPSAAPPEAPARERFVFTSGRLWDDGKNMATLDLAASQLAVPFVAAGPVTGPSGEAKGFRHLRLAGSLGEEEMRLWLAGAPVYASAARYEPFGLGVLEAAQAGCALVLSDIPTFRELWSGACLFVDPTDSAGFASAIERLLAEPALLQRLSARAMCRSRHYSIQRMAGEMMNLYASLFALGRTGRGEAA